MTRVVDVVGVSRALPVPGGTATVLAPTSLHVDAGEVVVLAGPSGSGKTTLCNLLLGWDRATSGTIEWAAGEPPDGWALAAVPQRLALLDHLTVRENVLLPTWAPAAGARGSGDAGADLAELASALDLAALLDRAPRELSLGQQQRVAVARALVGRPVLAVLDEPTGHQDEASASRVLDALRRAAADGSALVVASHDPEVLAVADRVVTLRAPG